MKTRKEIVKQQEQERLGRMKLHRDSKAEELEANMKAGKISKEIYQRGKADLKNYAKIIENTEKAIAEEFE